MSCEYAIAVTDLSKCYHIYDSQRDRLKQLAFCGKRQYFKEFWAVKDISFTIAKGQTVGILGRNGSGKSTLLQMICGNLNPSHGSIKTDGKVVALLELGAGFNPEFTGVENLYMVASLYGLSRTEIKQRFNLIADFADIGDYINHPVKTYSSGMYVRLAFAIVANVDADILVIDEALAVGDVYFTQKCIRYLTQFKQNNTLLFVSHDASAVQLLCDKAILLDHGSLVMEGAVINVLNKYHTNLLPREPTTTVPQRSCAVNPTVVSDVNELSGFDPTKNLASDVALILTAALFNGEGTVITVVHAGEIVCLRCKIQIKKSCNALIYGYIIKNRLGQVLLDHNSTQQKQDDLGCVTQGSVIEVNFEFEMPLLRSGEYTIDVTVAEGTQELHVNHQWIYEALVVQCLNPTDVLGMFDVKYKKISVIK